MSDGEEEEEEGFVDEHGEFCEDIVADEYSPENWRQLFNEDELNMAYQ